MKYGVVVLICLQTLFASCKSCESIDDVDNSVKSKQEIYQKQSKYLNKLQNLNANYLLHQSAINYELVRENKLLFIQSQIDSLETQEFKNVK